MRGLPRVNLQVGRSSSLECHLVCSVYMCTAQHQLGPKRAKLHSLSCKSVAQASVLFFDVPTINQ